MMRGRYKKAFFSQKAIQRERFTMRGRCKRAFFIYSESDLKERFMVEGAIRGRFCTGERESALSFGRRSTQDDEES